MMQFGLTLYHGCNYLFHICTPHWTLKLERRGPVLIIVVVLVPSSMPAKLPLNEGMNELPFGASLCLIEENL